MKFLYFTWGEERYLGILNAKNEVVPLKDLGFHFKNMNDLILNFSHFKLTKEELENAPSIPVPREQFLAPIPEPLQDIICLGINFLNHAKESAKFKGENFEKRENAVYFSKRVNHATAPFGKIPLHSDVTKQLDYECELAVILGKEAYKIKAEEAHSYIFGYTIINEISARDLQTKHKQFYRAKSLEGSTVMGPYITTSDEIFYPPQLNLKSFVNGELRQNDNTKNFIFDIAHVLEELSSGMRLKAGTIIAMGTPSGVGMGLEPPQFLKENDEVRCEIENLGMLCNKVF